MEEFIHTTLAWILPIVVTALLGWLSVKLNEFIKAKVNNEWLEGAILRAKDAAMAAVQSVEEAYVRAIKEGQNEDSEEGAKLTKSEQQKALDMALAAAKAYLGPKGIATLMHVLGLESEGALNQMLEGRIHAALTAKREQAGASPFVPPIKAEVIVASQTA